MPYENYYKVKMKKMGKWSVYPLDTEVWHGSESARYFKKTFGFGKGTLIIDTVENNSVYQHAYFPEWFFDKLNKYIQNGIKNDYKFIEKKLLKFYNLRVQLLKSLPKVGVAQVAKLSTLELIKMYQTNRDWVHRATVFDQIGWIAEDYWNLPMREILVSKGLVDNSPEYFQALFILTKPDEISTTLKEKRAVLGEVIKIKSGYELKISAMWLAKNFGWMPVAAYGEPWGAKHYEEELRELQKQDVGELSCQFNELKKYTRVRRSDIAVIVKKYNLSVRELQVFVDFSLVLDARNEAEYLMSYCSYHVLPLYKEMCKRLFLSTKQLRTLYEDEVVAVLRGQLNPTKILHERREISGYGYDKAMLKRYLFATPEAKKLFAYLEKTTGYIGENNSGKGICASVGRTVGQAKIVAGPQDNYKVKKGDIMISVVTMVDYLPAMKNASAIVTEVGSLTCHAAVVSREFGVPCVVSFKNATKIFKDGDMVEVDADKGVVRKIK